jgi:hypothetical protein
MSTLVSTIEKAADAFAKEIIVAVKAATLQELLAMQGGVAPTVTGAKRRGRPPKAKPGRKPGRPAKAKAKKVAKKAAKVRVGRRAKIKWPKCKHRGCKRNAWARGKGFCGEHFKALKTVKKK